MALQKDFEDHTRSQWLKQAEQDLKGNFNPDNFLLNYPEVSVDPFITNESGKYTYNPLKKFTNTPFTGFRITVTDAISDNKHLLALLENGANCLELKITGSPDPNLLFKDVFVSYLFIIIHFEQGSRQHITTFINFFNALDDSNGLHTLILDEGKIIFPNSSFYVSLVSGENKAVSLSSALMYADQHKFIDQKCNRVYFFTAVDKEFLLEIAYLRALRLVWENYCAFHGYEEDITPIIMAYPDFNNLPSEEPLELLYLSSITLSSILGNADGFITNTYSVAPGQWKYALHIQQVMMEESRIHQVNDPVAGSQLTEELTLQIAEAAWKMYVDSKN
jgi:hypothetical protein